MSKLGKTTIQEGDIIKVRITDGENLERVWGKVVELGEGDAPLRVALMNDPISEGFAHGDIIPVPIDYVLDKWEGE